MEGGILNDMNRLLRQSAGLYALFLLPTLLLLVYHPGDALVSRAIGDTWQGIWWHFPGLSGTQSRILLDILCWLTIGGITWLYLRALRSLDSTAEPMDGRFILRWTAILGLILLAVVPFHSSDLYGYINRGVQQTLYHTNPYLVPVGNIPGRQAEPLFHDHWIDNPCPYGFFFGQLTAWLSGLGNNRFIPIFLLFKTLNLALLIGSTALIARISHTLGQPRPWLAAALFGLNPLVLLHVMGNGHNDLLMSFLLLSTLWALQQARWHWLSLPLLTLSVLTKYASILAAPFVGLYLIRQKRWSALGIGVGLSAALIWLLGQPYIEPGQPWPWAAMLENAGKPQHSIIAMLSRIGYYLAPLFDQDRKATLNLFLHLLKPLALGGFGLFCLWLFVQCLRQPAQNRSLTQSVIQPAALAIIVLVTLVSAKFHPWYPLMFLPLALLLPEQTWTRRFAVLFSLFQIAGFTILQNIHILGVIMLTLVPLWLSLTPNFRRAAEKAS